MANVPCVGKNAGNELCRREVRAHSLQQGTKTVEGGCIVGANRLGKPHQHKAHTGQQVSRRMARLEAVMEGTRRGGEEETENARFCPIPDSSEDLGARSDQGKRSIYKVHPERYCLGSSELSHANASRSQAQGNSR